jgi:hypothetical protein
MESLVVTEVYTTEWNTVSLSNTYVSPIAVCTVKYATGTQAAVVRMRNLGSTSFDIRLQHAIDLTSEDFFFADVHCVVVEQGSWKMRDGRSIEARKYLSTVTDKRKSFVGQQQTYLNTYKNPIVLGQVMSYNNEKWSVFYSRGLDRSTAPDKENLVTGKQVGRDSDVSRAAETVGYIVIETGHDTSNGIEIETRRGELTVIGYVDGSAEYRLDTFDNDFSEKPAVAVLSQAGMKGTDGSWAVLTEISSNQIMKVAVDEDQFSNNNRRHVKQEEVDYIVFSAAGIVQLFPPEE